MHYVYVIKSLKEDYTYIGESTDLKQRFSEHNAFKVQSTKAYAPYRLVYYEAFAESRDAKIRERKLKQYGSSWIQLRKRLKFSL